MKTETEKKRIKNIFYFMRCKCGSSSFVNQKKKMKEPKDDVIVENYYHYAIMSSNILYD